MKGSNLIIAAVLSLVPCALVYAQDENTAEPIAVEQYKYGVRLDIAKVIQTPSLNFCDVHQVEMLYEDSAGKKHLMAYPVMGNVCFDGS